MEYEIRNFAKKIKRKLVRKAGQLVLGATALVGSWGCAANLNEIRPVSVAMGTQSSYEMPTQVEEISKDSNLTKIVMNRVGGSVHSRVKERGISLLPERYLEVEGEEDKSLMQVLFDAEESHTIYKGTKSHEDGVVLLFDLKNDKMVPENYADERRERWEIIGSKEAYEILLEKFTLEDYSRNKPAALNNILGDKSYILSAVEACLSNEEGINRKYLGRLFVSDPCDTVIYVNGVRHEDGSSEEGAKTYRLSFRNDRFKEYKNSTSPFPAYTTCPYEYESNGRSGDSGGQSSGANGGNGSSNGGATGGHGRSGGAGAGRGGR